MDALRLEQLTKTYRNGVQALKGIDLSVEAGDFFALLGPNGAGKTTAIGIITSLVNKSGGRVSVFGHDIDADLQRAKACIGVVPQEVNLPVFEKPIDILVNQAGFYGIPARVARGRAEKYLRELQLWDKRNDIARNLSGGMKRRLMIARALVHEPRLLILDEPTAGVDIEIRRSMWSFMKNTNDAGVTIILTTHYLEEAESLCRNVAIIDEGRIVENDRMQRVLRKLKYQALVLNVDEALDAAPALDGFPNVLLRNEHEIEVEVPREQSMNTLFESLSRAGLTISSLRNKTNRLEELFLRLVEHKPATEDADAAPAGRERAS